MTSKLYMMMILARIFLITRTINTSVRPFCHLLSQIIPLLNCFAKYYFKTIIRTLYFIQVKKSWYNKCNCMPGQHNRMCHIINLAIRAELTQITRSQLYLPTLLAVIINSSSRNMIKINNVLLYFEDNLCNINLVIYSFIGIIESCHHVFLIIFLSVPTWFNSLIQTTLTKPLLFVGIRVGIKIRVIF